LNVIIHHEKFKLSVLEDSHLQLSVSGDLHQLEVESIFIGLEQGLEQLRRADGKKVLLADVTKLADVHASGRRVVFLRLYNLGFDRIACFGRTSYIKYLIQFIIIGLRMSDRIRYFESEAAAREWLNS
jgi:hypothetical protein